MKRVSFSINNSVHVKLNSYGKYIYIHHLDKFNKEYGTMLVPCELRYDDRGWCEFQLWEFMNIFGEHLYMGAKDIPFETNIEFETYE